ncbi:MAG: winged helix-turn-helix transcriptional regulator [Candidatus Dormibacteraeota bacterium]|nr:winged helix-turn-helix transcriptional regulator [Candidatus Dormibacteraeota bacterium]
MAATSTRRSYDQYCAVARALDVVGDRWTLLIVRDLMLGPKRYKELLEGLPGIGTNLLAARLRELEAAGVVERGVLPPPAASAVYQLTEIGAALQPVLIALGRWGGRHFLRERRPEDVMVPAAYFVAMRSSFKPEHAEGVRERYEFDIGDRVFEVSVDGDTFSTGEGRTQTPDALFTMDVETLNALLLEGLTASEALAAGRVAVSGDAEALERFTRMFVIRPPAGLTG